MSGHQCIAGRRCAIATCLRMEAAGAEANGHDELGRALRYRAARAERRHELDRAATDLWLATFGADDQ